MRCRSLLLILLEAFFLFICILPCFSQEEQEHQSIVEKIEVNWWQVPIFAVDGNGNPIVDLKKNDFILKVNNKRVKEFEFYKRAFTVTSNNDEIDNSKDSGHMEAENQTTPVVKNNVVFLLFDVSLSAITCTKRSKKIAARIIADAQPGIQFILLTIEPFKGLNHIYGPSDNKEELLHKIKKKVIGKPNKRLVNPNNFFGDDSLSNPIVRTITGARKRYSRRDGGQLRELAATYYLRKNRCFFDSFKSLYLVFNSMADNKFVYFFSEGLTNSIRESSMGGRSLYNFHLKRMADYLSRSGAVLFIVNPMGVGNDSELVTENKDANSNAAGSATSYYDMEKSISGEDWLKYLAVESGGKYLEGGDELIVRKLEHMHRAYYEISFPDLPGLKGNSRRITIKPKGDNIAIHSLRALEKYKHYDKMTRIEKEMTALNIVVRNPLIKSTLSILPADIIHIEKNKKEVTYTILLPEDFLEQQLDLYKFRIKDDQKVIDLKTEKLILLREKLDIKFSDLSRKVRDDNTYFALVNGKSQKVIAYVMKDEKGEKGEK